MITLQTTVIPVPAVAATIFTDRDGPALQRTFVFRNLTDNVITLTMDYSDDGGANWESLVTSFTVAANSVVFQNITNGNQLRVRGSMAVVVQAANDRSLEISLIKVADLDLGTPPVTTRPYL